jgi:hypothetical protein
MAVMAAGGRGERGTTGAIDCCAAASIAHSIAHRLAIGDVGEAEVGMHIIDAS